MSECVWLLLTINHPLVYFFGGGVCACGGVGVNIDTVPGYFLYEHQLLLCLVVYFLLTYTYEYSYVFEYVYNWTCVDGCVRGEVCVCAYDVISHCQ